MRACMRLRVCGSCSSNRALTRHACACAASPRPQRVQPEDCSWTLATVGGARVLQLTLSKQKPLRWLGVLRSG
jgi:hypothetical protein